MMLLLSPKIPSLRLLWGIGELVVKDSAVDICGVQGFLLDAAYLLFYRCYTLSDGHLELYAFLFIVAELQAFRRRRHWCREVGSGGYLFWLMVVKREG